MTQTTSAATGAWEHGNEAIKSNAHGDRKWNGTVFKKGTQTLIALTFGETPQECSDIARMIAAIPATDAALAASRQREEELLSAVTLANECRADLSAENERLRKALEPFANLHPDDIEPRNSMQALFKQWCQRARAALSEKPAAEKEVG